MYKNFINGEWVEGKEGKDNINPSDTSDIVGSYARADGQQANAAVDAAVNAQRQWGQSTLQQRFDVLDAIGSEILSRKQELGRLLAREEGKIISDATGEVVRAGYIFKFFAGEALRYGGEHVRSVRPGVEIDILRQPLGVVGIITPWNYPIAIPRGRSLLRSPLGMLSCSNLPNLPLHRRGHSLKSSPGRDSRKECSILLWVRERP
jgi:acyl-CoA reductase-like NAD-dependent aldehyde dehydrogenase